MFVRSLQGKCASLFRLLAVQNVAMRRKVIGSNSDRDQLSSSTSKAHRVDSFASDTPVVRSCMENSGLSSLWLCQRESQILNPLLRRSTALIFAGSPEEPVVISRLPISLTPLSATSPSCFSPLHLWNLSFSFKKKRQEIPMERACCGFGIV